MVRSGWKHNHVYYKLFNFFERVRTDTPVIKKMKKSEAGRSFRIRNKTSFLQLDNKLLKRLSTYKMYVYAGSGYALLLLDKAINGSKLGEFIFTKIRGSGIHAIPPEKVARLGKRRRKVTKKYRKPRRLMGFNSHRARVKRELRYNRK